MAVRKEQVLVLVAVGIALLNLRSVREPLVLPKATVRTVEYEADPLPGTPLAEDADGTVPSRGLFREPRETEPLPPTDLPFPPRRPLGVVALPLPHGPGPSWAHLLAIDSTPVEGVELEQPQGGGDAAPPEDGGTRPPDQDSDEIDLERTYDRIRTRQGEFWGLLQADDKYALARMSPAELAQRDEPVRMRVYFRSRQELGRLQEFEGVTGVELARTLRNEVELRRRELGGKDLASRSQRMEFVDWLLRRAHEAGWVYDEALAQADALIEITQGALDAYRLKLRVLRERGALARELEMLDRLAAERGNSALEAFRLRSLGELEARLGLYRDAEKHLREAIAEAPLEPGPRQALAAFLLDRDRTAEALDAAAEAWRLVGNSADPAVIGQVGATRVRALLAGGRLERVPDALRSVQHVDDATLELLHGAYAYASGDLERALDHFRGDFGSRTEESGLATLGKAAVAVRRGEWSEALTLFRSIADNHPLLRHRAHTGNALLYERIGRRQLALAELERALEAHPYDWYAHYLRGHCLRLDGDYENAVGSLQECLRLRDDMLHAVAEMALAWAELAEVQPQQEAEHLSRALRYADRLVELDRERSNDARFHALQGRIRFTARQLRGARESFEQAVERAGTQEEELYGRAVLGLIAYAQGRTEQARAEMLALQDGLSSGHEYARYARATLERIDDHARKEQLVDRFERERLGRVWALTSSGAGLKFRIEDGRVVLRGSFDPRQPTVRAQRVGAVEKGQDFLGVETDLRVERAGARAVVGLLLELESRGGSSNLRVEYGLKGDGPYLRIEDGRLREGASPEEAAAFEPVRGLRERLALFQPDGRNRLGLEVIPHPERRNGRILVALWNGVELHRRELQRLSGSTRTPLIVALHAHDPDRGELAATFDDFRLKRRTSR